MRLLLSTKLREGNSYPILILFINQASNFYTAGNWRRVYWIAAGTGLYSLKLLERYPRAELTLIDFAGNMLDIARQIFSGNPNITYIQDDYSTYDFTEVKYDIVISALSIHHFHDEGKKKIYSKIYSLLDTRGELLNADQIAADSEPLDHKYRDIHTQFVKANATEAEYEQFRENIKLDRRSPIAAQLNWLKEAGFTEADSIFKLNCFAVMYASKKHPNMEAGVQT